MDRNAGKSIATWVENQNILPFEEKWTQPLNPSAGSYYCIKKEIDDREILLFSTIGMGDCILRTPIVALLGIIFDIGSVPHEIPIICAKP